MTIKKLLIIVFSCTLSLMLQAQDVHIFSNTTWTTNQTINGSLYIMQNAELRIEPGVTVDFIGSGGNRIIIRPEATLIASRVLFTSSTGRWFGIIMDALGDLFPQVGSTPQPRLVLTECTVLNTVIGVSNNGGILDNPLHEGGGWITLNRCTIADFMLFGAVFSKYRYQDGNGNMINDRSKIKETVFTSNYYAASSGIYLENVIGIEITGCKFIAHQQNAAIFIGVKILNASAKINAKQILTPPYNLVKNEFFDCIKGVFVNNSFRPELNVVIENSLFDYHISPLGERVAIQAISSNQLQVFSNEIHLKQDCYIPCTAPLQFGIHLNNCTGFHVENNYITVKPNQGSSHNTYGIVVVNSNGQSNEIYRNTIYGCHYAIQALNKNRGAELPWQPNDDGLRFFCNTLGVNKEGDYFALSAEVEPAYLTDPIYGVARMQGGSMVGIPTSPAFNEIERPNPLPPGSERDFFNNHQTPNSFNLTDVVYMEPLYTQGSLWYYLQYYTGNLNNFGVPNHVNPVQHPQITDDLQLWPRCESRIPSGFPGINQIAGEIQTAYDDFQIAMGAFMNYANDGDHNYMLAVANGIDSTNYIFAYFDFMTKNPSHDVLAIMAANESMPASYVSDILLQNTYGIKDGHVRDALANRADSLSQASLDAIFQAANGLSQYETYKMDVGYYSNQLRKLKNLQHKYYLSADTSLVDLNGIIAYLDADDDFQSKFSLLMHYYYQMDQGNVDIYKDALEQSTSDSYEIEDYHQLSEILDIIYFNYNGDYTQLSPSEIAMLESLVPGTTVASGIALSLLEGYLGYSFPLPAANLTSQTPRIGRIPDEPGIIGHIVYPNPAGSMVTVSLTDKVEGAQVIILDMAGRTVLTAPLTDASTTLDVSRLGNGIYIIRILGTNKPIGTEKLIINK